MKATFSFFLIISLFLISCPKDKTELPENTITITGITACDETGLLTGEVDTTDWNADAAFPDEVNTLLNFTDTLDYSYVYNSTISIFAYPNPFENQFSFTVSSTENTIMKYMIVDESLKVYTKGALNLNTGNHTISILTDNLFPANKYYRMYYALYNYTKTVYYKGHGDLKKN
jgi:hypothetical protein